jgi:hypothetical protein
MKKIEVLCGIILSGALNLAFADANNCQDLTQMDDPAIRLVGKFEESKNNRKYFYTVKNQTSENVKLVILGEGKDSDKIQILDENIAKKVISPTLWAGNQVYEEEGFYSKIVWTYESDSTQKKDVVLGLELGKGKQTKGIYSDGRPARATNFLNIQYTVYLSNGLCFFGKVLF